MGLLASNQQKTANIEYKFQERNDCQRADLTFGFYE
jgi:hypothetical protein